MFFYRLFFGKKLVVVEIGFRPKESIWEKKKEERVRNKQVSKPREYWRWILLVISKVQESFLCHVACSLRCPGVYIEEQKIRPKSKIKWRLKLSEIAVLSFIKIFWKSQRNGWVCALKLCRQQNGNIYGWGKALKCHLVLLWLLLFLHFFCFISNLKMEENCYDHVIYTSAIGLKQKLFHTEQQLAFWCSRFLTGWSSFSWDMFFWY